MAPSNDCWLTRAIVLLVVLASVTLRPVAARAQSVKAAVLDQSVDVPSGWGGNLTFSAAAFDTGGFWNASVPARLTVPAGVGFVRVVASVDLGYQCSVCEIYIVQNDAAQIGFSYGATANTGFGGTTFTAIAPVVAVSPGTYFTARVYQNTAGITTPVRFSIVALDGAATALSAPFKTVAIAQYLTVPSGWFAPLSFAAPGLDTGGYWNAAAPGRLTVPSGIHYVEVAASVFLDYTCLACQMQLVKNDAVIVGVSYGATANTGFGGATFTALAPDVAVTAGDYFTVRVYQPSGYDMTGFVRFSVVPLDPGATSTTALKTAAISQSLALASGWGGNLTFASSMFDTGGFWTASAPDQLAVTSAGYVQVAASMTIGSLCTMCEIYLVQNDRTYVAWSYGSTANTLFGGDTFTALAPVLYVSPGDYFTVRVYQNSGATLITPVQVSIVALDSHVASETAAPVVTAFDVQPRTTGGTVTATFTATDGGGAHMKSASLRRATAGPTCTTSDATGCVDWTTVARIAAAPGTDGPWTASLIDVPPASTSVYTLQVFDNAGNVAPEPNRISVSATAHPTMTWTGPTAGSQDLSASSSVALTTPGSYSVTFNTTVNIWLAAVSGGGGGGGNGGGGGGGAAYVDRMLTTFKAGETYTIVVGAGGGGGGWATNGTVGGSTTVTGANSGSVVNLRGGGGGFQNPFDHHASGGIGGAVLVGWGGGPGGDGGRGGWNYGAIGEEAGSPAADVTGPAGGGGGGENAGYHQNPSGRGDGGRGGNSASYAGGVGGLGHVGAGPYHVAGSGTSTTNTGGGGTGAAGDGGSSGFLGGGGGGGAGYRPVSTTKGFGGGGGGGGAIDSGSVGVGGRGGDGVVVFSYTEMTPPTITAFDVQPRNAVTTVSATFTTTDAGGAHLDVAELWRATATPTCTVINNAGCTDWAAMSTTTAAAGTDGPWNGGLTDSPASGAYLYLLRVRDHVGNSTDSVKIPVTVYGPVLTWSGPTSGSQNIATTTTAAFTTPGSYTLTVQAPTTIRISAAASGGPGGGNGGGGGGGGASTTGFTTQLMIGKTYTLVVGGSTGSGVTSLTNTTDAQTLLLLNPGGGGSHQSGGGAGGMVGVGPGVAGGAGGCGAGCVGRGGGGSPGQCVLTGAGGGGGGGGNAIDEQGVGGRGGDGMSTGGAGGAIGQSGAHASGYGAAGSAWGGGGGGGGGATLDGIVGQFGGGGGGGARDANASVGGPGAVVLTYVESPGAITSVVLTPGSQTVAIGNPATFTATAYDAANQVIPNVPFHWTTSSSSALVTQPSYYATTATVWGIREPLMVTASPMYGPSGSTAVTVDATHTLVYDSFTAGEGTLAVEHAPEIVPTGGGWSVLGSPQIIIRGEQLGPQQQTTTTNDAEVTIDSGATDGVIAVDWWPVATGTRAGFPIGGLVFRYQNTANYWVAGSGIYGSGLSLWRLQNATWTQVATSGITFTMQQPHRLEVHLAGAAIEVWWDGVRQMTVTDAIGAASSRHGLFAETYWDWLSTFDNFSVVGSSRCVDPLTPSSITADPNGETGTMFVTAPSQCSWNAFVDVSWMSLQGATSGTGSGAVSYVVSANSTAPNSNGAARAGTIIVGGRASVVTQQPLADPCNFSVFPNGGPFSADGGQWGWPVSVAMSSCEWTVESDAEWLVPLTTLYVGTGWAGFAIGRNDTGADRIGHLTIAGGRYDVVQGASFTGPIVPPTGCFNGVFPIGQTFGSAGGQASVTVSAPRDCGWTASSDASWITLTTASGTGDSILGYSVAPNTGASRTAVIAVGSSSHVVTQAASGNSPTGCSYSVSPASASFGGAGGTGWLQLTTGSACAWSVSMSAGWIHAAAGTDMSGTGPATLSYVVDPNPDPVQQRSAVLYISGSSPGSPTFQYPITQDAAGGSPVDCKANLTPDSIGAGSEGASDTLTVTVSAGCAWTTNSELTWLVLHTSSGVGAGSVGFSMAPNQTGADRSGTILVAENIISVFQAAKSPYTTCPEADPTDNNPDDEALQACLQQFGGGTIDLRAGRPGYIITTGLTLSASGTILRHSGFGKARIIAAPELSHPLLTAIGANDYKLINVVFNGELRPTDGNSARLGQERCTGDHHWASNLSLYGAGFLLDNVDSVGALCNSGAEVDGSGFEIRQSYFGLNGTAEDEPHVAEAWSDGLTILRCDSDLRFSPAVLSWVHDNTFEDNTDVDLIFGGGTGCVVERNHIQNTYHHAFAGLMIEHFPNGGGDHTGITYQYNDVTSAEDKLAYGIMVGRHPWDFRINTRQVSNAGLLIGNSSTGAVVNLAIDGITRGTVNDNVTTNHRGTYTFGQNCRLSADYTAADYSNDTGSAVIQAGSIYRIYHDGSCSP